MSKRLLALAIFFISFGSQAQNMPRYGYYMLNPSYFNPAWIGAQPEGFVAMQNRIKWLGYNSSFYSGGGAPNSQLLTGVIKIKNAPISAVGMNISNDMVGSISNLQVLMPISIPVHLRKGTLNIGIAPGIFNQTQNSNLLHPNEQGDPSIPSGRAVQMQMNLSSGLFYTSNRGWFVGVGAVNLLKPGFNYGLDSLQNKQAITASVHGGFNVSFNGFKLSPNAIVTSYSNNITFNLGSMIYIGDQIWSGLFYNSQESINLMLGYKLLENNKLKVGYSFEYVVQNQNGKAPTTHELYLRYDLPNWVFGGKKSIKTPRFTY